MCAYGIIPRRMGRKVEVADSEVGRILTYSAERGASR
jgi:hypothetical protein